MSALQINIYIYKNSPAEIQVVLIPIKFRAHLMLREISNVCVYWFFLLRDSKLCFSFGHVEKELNSLHFQVHYVLRWIFIWHLHYLCYKTSEFWKTQFSQFWFQHFSLQCKVLYNLHYCKLCCSLPLIYLLQFSYSCVSNWLLRKVTNVGFSHFRVLWLQNILLWKFWYV